MYSSIYNFASSSTQLESVKMSFNSEVSYIFFFLFVSYYKFIDRFTYCVPESKI